MNRNSIKKDIVSDIVGLSKGELLPVERLSVAHNSGLLEAVNERWLVDLYMECGCLSEAEQIYTGLRHWRKLGDLCWMRNDLERAFLFYSKPGDTESTVFRAGPDWDRMIKLSVYRENWETVIRLFGEAPISPGTSAKRIFLDNSEVAAGPYLQFHAIAVHLLGRKSDRQIAQSVVQGFGISADEWSNLLSAASADEDRSIDSARKRCLPPFPTSESLSLSEALARGGTARAEAILDFLGRSDVVVAEARRLAKSFLDTGQVPSLHRLVKIIDATHVESVTRTFLFAALHCNSYYPVEAPPERLVHLYGCHPVMRRIYFGAYLRAKLSANIALSGADLLTGIFQRMALVDYQLDPFKGENILDFRKLCAYRDWAEGELDKWAATEGEQLLLEMRRGWPDIETALRDTRQGLRYSVPSSPREMRTWNETLKKCFEWLANRWESGIGASQWKSEELLFKSLKESFKGEPVVQHAQPIWLEPQHLDIFVPARSLAVEYMGQQHYCAVEFFGGQEGLKQTAERDRRKAELCHRCGIKLIYVRYDEDMATRVKEIKAWSDRPEISDP